MTHRSARNRTLFFAVFLALVPVLDVVVGGAAGLLHFITALSGIGLLAAALSSGHPRIGYARYDES